MLVQLCGKKWSLKRPILQTHRGECDAPNIPKKEMRVDKRLKGQEELEVLIHEAMHAIDWKSDEEHVSCASSDLARMLWRLGYRRNG